ncbi:DNA replication complex GINS protein PSF2 [Microplitis demolitor]|uniref:DNA replication complex GINS protein PSF2 n=1 Tax=Microplitis demolitor TaxID=69319 RepID=UPI0006D4D9E5|nr:DNA replication complex GINS protein PSF2 [Microplitis demolitor]
MDPHEVEFLGEKKLVDIVPNFNFGQIHLISGSIGPFRASLPVKVPIWLAISLKQQQKCRILCPDWMQLENLDIIKENEKQSKDFTAMPSKHYMDVTHILLNVASDDFVNVDSIRTIVKDIWDMRMSKLRTSIDDLFRDQNGIHALLKNLTLMEITSLRPFVPSSMDQLQRIKLSEDHVRSFQTQGSQ